MKKKIMNAMTLAFLISGAASADGVVRTRQWTCDLHCVTTRSGMLELKGRVVGTHLGNRRQAFDRALEACRARGGMNANLASDLEFIQHTEQSSNGWFYFNYQESYIRLRFATPSACQLEDHEYDPTVAPPTYGGYPVQG